MGQNLRNSQLATPTQREFRTILRNGARKGPNFAGHYTVVEWGCGSNCVVFAVVDARNGEVHERNIPPMNDQYPCGLLYKVESTLFVVEKSSTPGGACEAQLYTWDGSHFVSVQNPAPSAQNLDTACTTVQQAETSAWRVYTDRDHHFCFRYPRSYRPILHPKPRCRGPKLEDRKTEAKIGVCVLDEVFQTASLVEMAPTGIDSPPEPVRIGKNTFYYYGPGGGGVDYPDGYYYNLRGKILVIDFDGPYENDKTPTPATKKMEQKVLASFREF